MGWHQRNVKAGTCTTQLIGKVKGGNGKKEEPTQHTNQQMQGCKEEKIMEAGHGHAFEEKEQERTFYDLEPEREARELRDWGFACSIGLLTKLE